MQIKQLINTQTKQFVVFNFLGWLAYFLNSIIGPIYWDKPVSYFWVVFYSSVFGFVISFALRPIYQFFWGVSVKKLFFVVAFSCLIFSAIWSVLYNLLYVELSPSSWKPKNLLDYFLSGSKIYYIFFCWSCLYFGTKFYREIQNASKRVLKANALAHQAQLKMLRYQLNPHFLFNTLNAISTLILKKENETANEMVARLSNFLRYSLDNDPLQKVTLDQEITTLKLYLCIEKVRFEERLQLDFQVDEVAGNALIPSLFLQPLIENSIKYAVAKSETTGTISLHAKVFANELLIELKDDGPGVELVNGELPCGRGVGITNTKQRLQELYDGQHSFVISNVKPTGLQISIRLPYETGNSE